MKRIFAYTVSFSAIGVLIGLIISLFFNYLNGASTYYPSAPTFVSQFNRPLNSVTASIVLWMLIGILFGFGSLIFDIKKWSLIKKTIINFCVYYLGFVPLAIMCGWFPLSAINLAIFTLIFIVIYAIIWFYSWYQLRKEIAAVNNKVKK